MTSTPTSPVADSGAKRHSGILKSFSQFFSDLIVIQLGLVPADTHTGAGIMIALQYKLVRKCVKVDLVRIIPHTQQGNQIFFTDLFGNVFPYSVLVHQLRIQRISVIELQPLELFIEQLRILQVQRLAHFSPVDLLNVSSVIQMIVESHLGKPNRTVILVRQFILVV